MNKEKLLSLLKAFAISYEYYKHPPVFTVAESKIHCKHILGQHVKNLFLSNKKKTCFWLITVPEEKQVDMHALALTLNSSRLGFVNEERMLTILGVAPGSVTPLAILNDHDCQTSLLLDKDLLNQEYIAIHPMENTATLRIKINDLLRFLKESRQITVEFIEILAMAKK